MDQYYISAELNGERVRVILDATTNVNETYSGSLNKFIFDNGDQGSDNYVNNSNRISFSGILTDIKSLSSVLTYEEINTDTGAVDDAGRFNVNKSGIFDNEKVFLKAAKNKSILEKIKTNKVPVIVKVANREVYNNCYITSVSFVQTKSNGVSTPQTFVGREFSSDELTSSYRVTITFEQVRLGARATTAVVRSEELVDAYLEDQQRAARKLQTAAEAKKRAETAARDAVRQGVIDGFLNGGLPQL